MNITNLNYIEFTFKNCEVMKIPGKYIGDFWIDGIHTAIERITANYVTKIDYCDNIVIEIHRKANTKYYPFDLAKDNWKTYKFNQLKVKNITQIKINLIEENNTDKEPEEYTYKVEWNGDNEYINKAQHVYESSSGHLYIVIDKDNDVDDIFGDRINDEEEMKFHFRMLGIS